MFLLFLAFKLFFSLKCDGLILKMYLVTNAGKINYLVRDARN